MRQGQASFWLRPKASALCARPQVFKPQSAPQSGLWRTPGPQLLCGLGHESAARLLAALGLAAEGLGSVFTSPVQRIQAPRAAQNRTGKPPLPHPPQNLSRGNFCLFCVQK
jgi:hypothetical protein